MFSLTKILDSMMNGTVYELLTNFLKMKPLSFQGIEFEDAFEFTIDLYECLHKWALFSNTGFSF